MCPNGRTGASPARALMGTWAQPCTHLVGRMGTSRVHALMGVQGPTPRARGQPRMPSRRMVSAPRASKFQL